MSRFSCLIPWIPVLLIAAETGCRTVECAPEVGTAMAPPVVYERLSVVVQPHVGVLPIGTMSVSTQLNDSRGCEDLLCSDLAAALINTGRFSVVPNDGVALVSAPAIMESAVTAGAMPAGPDVIVNIEVHEFYPYQPMRLRATFHLINPATGLVQSSISGAWESSGDFQPIEPSREGNTKLRRPVIPAIEEARALTRTSPRTFLNAVAHEVAASVVQSVYPVSVEATAVAESVPATSRRRR